MGKYLPIIKIAQCGSFNKAAGELGYSQPNLWHIVNNLEADLGARLFHRSRQGVTLTEAGKSLLERMERIEAQERGLHQMARSLHKEQVRVGVFPGLPGHWLAELLVSWKAAYPDLAVKLETPGSYRDGLSAVREQTLDLCFSVLPGMPEVEAHALAEDPYYLVAGADHPLAQMEQASLKDVLGSCPLIPNRESFDPDSPLWEIYRRTEHVLMADSAPPDPQASVALAEKGMGVALLPGMVLEGLAEKDSVRYIPLSDGLSRPVTLLCGREEDRSPVAEGIVRLILRFAEGQRGAALAC